MNRYTIWRKQYIVGTFEGVSEHEALDNLAKSEGHANFEDSNEKLGFTRDDYSVKKVG